MAQLDTHFGDSAAQLSDELADTVDWSPDGVQAVVTAVAIIGREETRQVVEEDGIKSRYVRTVNIPLTTAAAGGGTCLPSVQLHDQLTIPSGTGELYTIEVILSRTVNWIHCEAHRLATREKTRQKFRRT
jgi:hypothetical protein